MIRIIHKNRMQMLCRNRSLENSLKAWEEKQKQCLSTPGEKSRNSSLTLQRPSVTLPRHSTGHLSVNITEKLRQHSFSGQTLTVPRAHHEKSHSITYIENILPPSDLKFNEEEHNLLLNFIECATTLAKWIKLLAISNPKMDIDLYAIAEKIEKCLERIHPHGKLLEGDILRIEFSKLYEHVKQLFEDSCCLLRDKGHNLKLRDDLETKLSITLANTEMELRKCVLVDTPKGNLVFLHQIHEEHVSIYILFKYVNRIFTFWIPRATLSLEGMKHQSPTSLSPELAIPIPRCSVVNQIKEWLREVHLDYRDFGHATDQTVYNHLSTFEKSDQSWDKSRLPVGFLRVT